MFDGAFVMRLASGATNPKACSASLLALLPLLFGGCANSCVFGFWNPPNGTIGAVTSNPPPACKLPSPKAAIRVEVQIKPSCDLCSGSNRVHAVVLNLSGIDVHSSANAAGESSGWQPLLSEPAKHPRQVELLTERLNPFSSESIEELPIPAGSYDRVRLRFDWSQEAFDNGPLRENKCGNGMPSCVILADGQFAPLTLEANALELRLNPEATTAGGSVFVIPGSHNELLIELTPALSIVPPFGEVTRPFFIYPGRAIMNPAPSGEAPVIPSGT